MIKPTSPQISPHAVPAIRHMVRGPQSILLVCALWLAPDWIIAQSPGCGNVCALYSDLVLAPERNLIGSIRTIQKVAKPAVGPRNTRGRWIQREIYLGSEAFDTTFYLGSGLIQRIELVSTASDAQCRARNPWANTVAALSAWQDKGAVTGQFDTGSGIQQSIHWVAGEVDVTAYLSVTAEVCSTKVAFKKREVKDASSL